MVKTKKGRVSVVLVLSNAVLVLLLVGSTVSSTSTVSLSTRTIQNVSYSVLVHSHSIKLTPKSLKSYVANCCDMHVGRLLAAVIGCGDSGPKLYTIKGTLTYKGKPVPYVLLTFTPDDQNTKSPATSGTDQDGRFEMKIGSQPGVFPGPHKITCMDPQSIMGAKSSTDPDYIAVTTKYAPGKSVMTINIEKNESNLKLELD